MNDEKLSLTTVRTQLKSKTGKKYWKSLEALTESTSFIESVRQEYPSQAALLGDALDRRKFLQIMGASFALAGITACGVKAPDEKIVPYVKAPEEIIPGKPLFFATSMVMGGFAKGLLVESHMGRPTKVEGNPEHPSSLGATDIFAQASVLSLYDPDRSQAVKYFGEIRSWEVFLKDFRAVLSEHKKNAGTGIAILTETITSPTFYSQIQAILKDYPNAKWCQYEPINRDNYNEGTKTALGNYAETVYAFDKAEVVLSLGSDFLTFGPGNVRYTKDLMSKRQVREEKKEMNRLYVAEAMPSNTGSVADHRLPVKSSEIESLIRALAINLGISITGTTTDPHITKWIEVAAKDLKENKGKSIVIVGDNQPPVVHALVHAINSKLENIGKTVLYTDPVEASPSNQVESLKQLVQSMNSGQTDLIVILGGNPVYNAPADFRFADALKKVKYCVHLSQHYDETSMLCHWHIPETHYLEAWSDARTYDGTVSIVQPLIAPLYKDAKSSHEMLATFLEAFNQSGYDTVKNYWKTQYTTEEFEPLWRKTLHDGLKANSALQTKTFTIQMDKVVATASQLSPVNKSLEVTFAPDSALFDGRFANNGWLQELPKSITRLTWDNTALLSKTTADQLNVKNEDLIDISFGSNKISRIPVWIVPGHANDSITVHLGFGRTQSGHVGNEIGVNTYLARTSSSLSWGLGASVNKLNEIYKLACTQEHHSMEGRSLIRSGTLEEYKKDPEFAKEEEVDKSTDPLTLYTNDDHKYDGYAWGMAIDTSSCTGCNACVVACQSENNSPIVGKEEVMRGREMQWLRIDRYFSGDDEENPDIHLQPVMCMHCEAAPCEIVCPVEATAHSSEGLNEMTYNRCIGTKYCSNNCPYKVRRFNFLSYSDFDTPVIQLGRNPNVTVRSRGVMEKCTYCVQRINSSRIEAEKEDRQIRDGEVTTACQGACPANAIVFGNINDPNSRVSKLKAEATNYGLLAELNVRPRTSYLATIRNPHPELQTNHKKSE